MEERNFWRWERFLSIQRFSWRNLLQLRKNLKCSSFRVTLSIFAKLEAKLLDLLPIFLIKTLPHYRTLKKILILTPPQSSSISPSLSLSFVLGMQWYHKAIRLTLWMSIYYAETQPLSNAIFPVLWSISSMYQLGYWMTILKSPKSQPSIMALTLIQSVQFRSESATYA